MIQGRFPQGSDTLAETSRLSGSTLRNEKGREYFGWALEIVYIKT